MWRGNRSRNVIKRWVNIKPLYVTFFIKHDLKPMLRITLPNTKPNRRMYAIITVFVITPLFSSYFLTYAFGCIFFSLNKICITVRNADQKKTKVGVWYKNCDIRVLWTTYNLFSLIFNINYRSSSLYSVQSSKLTDYTNVFEPTLQILRSDFHASVFWITSLSKNVKFNLN